MRAFQNVSFDTLTDAANWAIIMKITFSSQGGFSMSSTKDAMKKILEAKQQGTKNQGLKKRADKSMGGGSQTNKSQRSGGSMVNKSV